MAVDWTALGIAAVESYNAAHNVATTSVDTATSDSGGVWGWVNDQIDTYVWDTDSDVAVVEGWVKGLATDLVDNVGDGVSSAWDWVNEQVDTYIWDTDSDEAIVEGWIKDVGSNLVDGASGVVSSVWDWIQNLLFDPDTGVVEDVDKVVDDIVDFIRDPKFIYDLIEDKIKELSLDPLGDILLGLIDIIGMRLEAWITNALGLVETKVPPEEKEE